MSRAVRLLLVTLLAGVFALAGSSLAYGQAPEDCDVANPQTLQECLEGSGESSDGTPVTSAGEPNELDDVDEDNEGEPDDGGSPNELDDVDEDNEGESHSRQTTSTQQNNRPRVTVVEDFDCADFSSQADAQRVLNANTRDPHNLDSDNDGFACEGRFVTFVRTRSVLARTGAHALEIALAGGLCLLGSLALRRRFASR